MLATRTWRLASVFFINVEYEYHKLGIEMFHVLGT